MKRSIMLEVLEDKRNEFKIKLTDNIEKEVIAFLNTDGGNVFIGIDDNGNIVGNIKNLDLLQRTINDRIKITLCHQQWVYSMLSICCYNVAILLTRATKYDILILEKRCFLWNH